MNKFAKHCIMPLCMAVLACTAVAATDPEPTPPRSVARSASTFVVVDKTEPAFIVFTGIPKKTEAAELESIKQRVSAIPHAEVITWQQFVERVDEYVRSIVIRNDYPEHRVVDGLICLVGSKKGTGAPWGITWNGGIALTYNDYEHAKETFATYKTDPAAYRPVDDPRGDPVNPGAFLPFFECD